MQFKDHFSRQARDYARYRPTYPRDLFDFLAIASPDRALAWDCATGNGQVALKLADHFTRIHASDASALQIENAFHHERIDYFVSPAESTPLASGTIDLVTVGQAIHWFDCERFFTEARRVLRPGGTLAFWTYGSYEVVNAPPELKAILLAFDALVAPFWPPEIHLVADRYRSILFPFEEFQAPEFTMAVEWTAEQLIGCLGTWSATQRFIDERGSGAIEATYRRITDGWGSPDGLQSIHWPIYLRIGRS